MFGYHLADRIEMTLETLVRVIFTVLDSIVSDGVTHVVVPHSNFALGHYSDDGHSNCS